VGIRHEIRIQPPGLLGCLAGGLLLLGLVVLGSILLWPLLGLALGVALGVVLLGVLALAYFRLKWAIRGFLRRRSGTKDVYEADGTEVADPDADADDDDPDGPRKRLTVQVRRRPR